MIFAGNVERQRQKVYRRVSAKNEETQNLPLVF